MDDKRDWILSQIDVNGRRICEKMNWSESPLRSRSGGGMEIGDFIWHFYISLWSFHTLTLVLRRLTNPKKKFATYGSFFWTNLTRKTFSNKNIDPWILLMFIFYVFLYFCVYHQNIVAWFARFDRCNLSFWHMSIKIYHNIKSTIPTFWGNNANIWWHLHEKFKGAPEMKWKYFHSTFILRLSFHYLLADH